MNILKRINTKHILVLILLSTLFFRVYRLGYPEKFVFDEVYHAFTAKEYLLGHKEAWEWWTTPPPGVAYEWTHPPLAKEIMAISMFLLHSQEGWVWRLPGALLGVLSVLLIYLLGIKLFNNQAAALLSSFVFSVDGLNFVQSRIGMNDIYYITLLLISLLFLLRKGYLISAIFFGLALSCKWAGIYFFFLVILILFRHHQIKMLFLFILIPPIIYLLSYLPFFLLGHDFSQFIQLQQQMWWYHTGLKATHNYSSPWWSWPLNLYPVWYFVDYQENTIANIFASGNPIVFWVGTLTVVLAGLQAIKEKSFNLLLVVLGFLFFWLPWALSPRIMFLYHFSPSVPFLSLALGHQLSLGLADNKRGKKAVYILLVSMTLSFILLFPFLTGIPIPKSFVNLFFLTNMVKNPF